MEPLTGRSPRDQNRVPVTYGLLNTDGVTVKPIEVDSSGNLLVNVAVGGGGGTQYTDGGVPPAHPIGATLEWSDGANWQTVSTAKPLPVSATLTNPTIGNAVPSTGNYIAASKAGTLTGLLLGSQTGANSLAVVVASDQGVLGTVGSSPNAINVGQQTVNTTAVQVSASATVPTNGILVQALSTNGASIFVGGSGVTTSNGWELSAGQAIAFTCTLNTIYIISAASTTDKVCYQVV